MWITQNCAGPAFHSLILGKLRLPMGLPGRDDVSKIAVVPPPN
jgi:hypothetical protein